MTIFRELATCLEQQAAAVRYAQRFIRRRVRRAELFVVSELRLTLRERFPMLPSECVEQTLREARAGLNGSTDR
jgi:hypothetical protein